MRSNVVVLLSATLVVLASGTGIAEPPPSDIGQYQRQCRFNEFPEDPYPQLQACQRAALYFSMLGRKGYSAMYTRRACALSTKRSCRFLRETVRRVERNSSLCARASASTSKACAELARDNAHLVMPGMRLRNAATPGDSGDLRGPPRAAEPPTGEAARPAKARARSRLFLAGVRVANRCLRTGALQDCLALAMHHAASGSPPAVVEAAIRGACSTGPAASCGQVRRLVDGAAKRFGRCREGSSLACELARASLRKYGLVLHANLMRPSCVSGRRCLAAQDGLAETWSAKDLADHRFHREACRSGYRPSCSKASDLERKHRSVVRRD